MVEEQQANLMDITLPEAFAIDPGQGMQPSGTCCGQHQADAQEHYLCGRGRVSVLDQLIKDVANDQQAPDGGQRMTNAVGDQPYTQPRPLAF